MLCACLSWQWESNMYKYGNFNFIVSMHVVYLRYISGLHYNMLPVVVEVG